MTTHAGHGAAFVASAPFDGVDAVLVVGGDGMCGAAPAPEGRPVPHVGRIGTTRS